MRFRCTSRKCPGAKPNCMVEVSDVGGAEPEFCPYKSWSEIDTPPWRRLR